MRLWVLSALIDSPTDARLLAAARARGHDTELVRPGALPDGPAPDGVLTRTGASAPPEALATLAALEARGIPCLNASAALARARDKWCTAEVLARAGVPTPRTWLVAPAGDLPDDLGEPPWYVKPPVGTQGHGVERVGSREALRAALDAAQGTRLVQEEAVGLAPGDLRVLVVDGVVLAAMRRVPAPGEHRANLHQGGRAEAAPITPATERCAREAALALGLDVAGVDLIETADGPRVLEVNGASGLVGLETTSGRDLAGELVRALERRLTPA